MNTAGQRNGMQSGDGNEMDERSRTKQLPGEKNKTSGFDITIPIAALLVALLFALPYEFVPNAGMSTLVWFTILAGIVTAGLWFGVLRIWVPGMLSNILETKEISRVKAHAGILILLLFLFHYASVALGVAVTTMTGENFQEVRVMYTEKRAKRSIGCTYYLTDGKGLRHCIDRAQYRAYKGLSVDAFLRGRRSSWGTLIDHLELPPATTTN